MARDQRVYDKLAALSPTLTAHALETIEVNNFDYYNEICLKDILIAVFKAVWQILYFKHSIRSNGISITWQFVELQRVM